MSETIRSYSAGTHPSSRRALYRGPQKRPSRRRVVFWAVVLSAAYIYWIGRDTHPMREFVPSERRAHIFVSDVIRDRHAVAESEIWKALPPSDEFQMIPRLLARDFPLPEWMLRNLVGDVCHVSRERLDGPGDDLLVVTRMTRVGCLLARLQWLAPGIALDEAGGLDVHRVGDDALFFAVRGRTLIISPSRRALIYSLTLTENERMDTSVLAYEFAESERVTARGSIYFDETEAAGQWFDHVRFAARVDADAAHVRLRGAFRPDLDSRAMALIERAQPVPLVVPYEGPLALSVDLSTPLRDLWQELGVFSDAPVFGEGQWSEWESGDLDESVAPALSRLLGATGPGMRLTWLGIDENELFPTPELLLSVDADPENVQTLMTLLPRPRSSTAIDVPHAVYAEESQRMYIPTVSGPTLEITAAMHDDALLVSNSRPIAERYLSFEPSGHQYLRDKGNVFLSATPARCVEELQDTAILLAENGLLKGHTPESIRERLTQWRGRAAIIDNVTLTARIRENALEIVIDAQCAPATNTALGD